MPTLTLRKKQFELPAELTDVVPARRHTKTHLHYHARIQKKWNKRYGYLHVSRVAGRWQATDPQPQNIPKLARAARDLFAEVNAGFDALEASRTPNPLSRAARAAESAARAANPPTEAELRKEWAYKLVCLCDDMIHECRARDCTADFAAADNVEAQFIHNYMTYHAPDVIFTIKTGGGRQLWSPA